MSKGLHRFHDTASYEWFDEYDKWRDGARVHFDAKIGTDLRSNHGDLFVPKGYKVIKVKATPDDEWQKKNRDKNDMPPGPITNEGSEDSPIQPGNILDAELRIMTKTSAMEIKHDGIQYYINKSAGLNYVDSIIHLVRDHGFREDLSHELLKQASQHRKGGAPLRLPREVRRTVPDPRRP